jgi:CRP/FNR family cyclic AMP-dependent transcriptional regulator
VSSRRTVARNDLGPFRAMGAGGAFLRALGPKARQILAATGTTMEFGRDSTIFRPSDAPPRAGVVLSGLLRAYLSSADGRQATVRYAGPGSSIGLVSSLFGGRRAYVGAVLPSTIFLFDMKELGRLARTEVSVAWAIAEDVSRRLDDSLEVLAANTFGSLPERVTRQLLAVAVSEKGGMPFAPVTQKQLADDVGTAREVVARALRELRNAGLIRTERSGVVLLARSELEAIVGLAPSLGTADIVT